MGWSALTETATTHFQARALSHVQTIAFDGTALSVVFEENHSLGYEMMKRLLPLVTERLDHTRMQLIDMYGKRSGETFVSAAAMSIEGSYVPSASANFR